MNLNKMQKKIDKLLFVFTGLINELCNAIEELKDAIDDNNVKIEKAKAENDTYYAKIDEYETLKMKVENIIS